MNRKEAFIPPLDLYNWSKFIKNGVIRKDSKPGAGYRIKFESILIQDGLVRLEDVLAVAIEQIYHS
jgi:hypothetical protein